jgi:type IV secretion system protein VirB4
LPPTPAKVDFLKSWLRLLAQNGQGAAMLPVREESDLELALRGTLALDLSERRLSRLIEFLDPTTADGVYARLSPWCHLTGGDYAWAFDNPEDLIVPRLAANSLIGFDCTDQINHLAIRTPMTAYLLHVVSQLLGTRRLVCFMDEFQALLADPSFAGFADASLPTWRKLDGVMFMATQSPRKVIESPISRSVIEQTPTKIFLPNNDATREDYIEGFGLTEREFKLIKEQLEPGSRSFLIKQGRHSVVCQLDLKGFARELAVISGRSATVEIMNRAIAAYGPAPQDWLSPFYAAALSVRSSSSKADPIPSDSKGAP